MSFYPLKFQKKYKFAPYPRKKCEPGPRAGNQKQREGVTLRNGGTKWRSWEEKSCFCRQIEQVSQLRLHCICVNEYLRLRFVIQRVVFTVLERILQRKRGRLLRLPWRSPMKDRIVSVRRRA